MARNSLLSCFYQLLILGLIILILPQTGVGQNSPLIANNSPEIQKPVLFPPKGVYAKDTPRDGGLSITIRWQPLEVGNLAIPELRDLNLPIYILECPGSFNQPVVLSATRNIVESLIGCRIYRSDSLDGKFVPIGEVEKTVSEYNNIPNDSVSFEMGKDYYYRVAAVDSFQEAMSNAIGPVRSHPTWFDYHRLPVLLAVMIFFGSVLVFVRVTKKGKGLFIRRIAAIAAIDEAIGRATELGRPVLYVPGIMDVDNIQTIASMVILANVAKLAAQYDIPIIVPLNRAFVVPMAEEAVRQGFFNAGRPDAYNPDNIRYLSDEQFAFTGGVNGIMNREKTAAHFFLGAFFAESLILSEMGFATGAIQIAGTANIHQLPFFVVACDYTLIGEEFYAATAYISRSPELLGPLKGADFMKALISGLLIIGSLLELAGVHVLTNLLTLS